MLVHLIDRIVCTMCFISKWIEPLQRGTIYLRCFINVTGPAKRDQVGTKYIISQNGTYLEFCVQYLLSVSCKMLPMKVFIYGKIFIYIDLADH